MPEPRRFHTLEEATEYFNLQFSRVELEPAPLVRSAKRLELTLKRDDALRALAQEIEARAEDQRAALTPPPPPRPAPEPLPSTASDDERARRLYGDRLPIQPVTRAQSAPEPPDDPSADVAAAQAFYGDPISPGHGRKQMPFMQARIAATVPPTPGDDAL